MAAKQRLRRLGVGGTLGFLGQTRGWAKKANPVTPGDVREHLDEILDTDGHFTPVSANDQVAIVERLVLGRAV